jgi:hypothetical protein
MDLGELREQRRWKELEQFYTDGYYDAKAGHYRNDYPDGSLRWHSYECGWITADNFFNRQPDNREQTTTT